MTQPNFVLLEKKIGLHFKDRRLLVQALTHRSYLNENPEAALEHLEHNERLEFLGDAVLELVSTEYLFKHYPQKNEGELTIYRAAAVNADMLARAAAGVGLNDFLLLSRGEAKDFGRARQSILANAFEALIGAIYLDQGLEAVRNFIFVFLLPPAKKVFDQEFLADAKSLFQEKAQELKGLTPVYRLLAESGPDHDKIFRVGLYLGVELIAEGEGSSKQRAEQEAARRALALSD